MLGENKRLRTKRGKYGSAADGQDGKEINGVFVMEEKRGKIYNIEDIARELGVSKTTVSRAISGKGRISKATTERVMEFIATHDYRPNLQAKGLAKSRTYNLGMLMPVEYGSMDFPFFQECLRGICEMAAGYNYDIVICMVNGSDLTQLQRIVTNRKVDGMILSRAVVSSAAQKYMKEKNVPFVVIGPETNPDIPSVDNQNREACRELTSIMLLKGMNRLALIGGDDTYLVTESRYEGFADAYRKSGKSLEEDLVFFNAGGYQEISRAVEEALKKKAEGILCMDDVICREVLACLREKGIRIPEDMKVASFYDNSFLELNTPSVTSIRFDTHRLGEKACETLLQILGEKVESDGKNPGYQVILRESTKTV